MLVERKIQMPHQSAEQRLAKHHERSRNSKDFQAVGNRSVRARDAFATGLLRSGHEGEDGDRRKDQRSERTVNQRGDTGVSDDSKSSQ